MGSATARSFRPAVACNEDAAPVPTLAGGDPDTPLTFPSLEPLSSPLSTFALQHGGPLSRRSRTVLMDHVVYGLVVALIYEWIV